MTIPCSSANSGRCCDPQGSLDHKGRCWGLPVFRCDHWKFSPQRLNAAVRDEHTTFSPADTLLGCSSVTPGEEAFVVVNHNGWRFGGLKVIACCSSGRYDLEPDERDEGFPVACCLPAEGEP
jgi:hypothetical protein